MISDPAVVLAGSATALAVGLILRLVLKPPRRLQGRVEPYLSPRMTPLTIDSSAGRIKTIFGPMVTEIAHWVGARLDRSGGSVTLLRLRQAGWFTGLAEEEMLTAYRVRQLRNMLLSVAIAVALGVLTNLSTVPRVLLIGLGLVVGITRTKGTLDRAIEARRELMKIEIYTVNQLLAMRVRAGGGVIQAVKATCDRGTGDVVAELRAALRLHRSGWRGPDAFRRIAELTPEPFCSRTYRLLATAEERGADLGSSLLSLSEDVRETRRESIKRTATKRRAAMLVPTIAILAPVLILFVAAPLPYLITSWQ